MIGLRKFRLVSADARGRGTRDEFLRESAWEANSLPEKKINGSHVTAQRNRTR